MPPPRTRWKTTYNASVRRRHSGIVNGLASSGPSLLRYACALEALPWKCSETMKSYVNEGTNVSRLRSTCDQRFLELVFFELVE